MQTYGGSLACEIHDRICGSSNILQEASAPKSTNYKEDEASDFCAQKIPFGILHATSSFKVK